jgi:hypothetical protein
VLGDSLDSALASGRCFKIRNQLPGIFKNPALHFIAVSNQLDSLKSFYQGGLSRRRYSERQGQSRLVYAIGPDRKLFARQANPYFALGFHKAIAAPVGSMRTLNEPTPMISVTSFITVAPSDLAFFVEVATSSTRT